MPCGAISSIVMRLPFTDLELSLGENHESERGGKLYIGEGTIFGHGASNVWPVMVSQILKLRLHLKTSQELRMLSRSLSVY